METRRRATGLEVSILVGCGAVGGLMVRGTRPTRASGRSGHRTRHQVLRHRGDVRGSESEERNLGRVAKSSNPTFASAPRYESRRRRSRIEPRWPHPEAPQRLQLEQVDLFQLHNHITRAGHDSDLTPGNRAR
jgi:hypothetical protein